jgi:hypothetical protein
MSTNPNAIMNIGNQEHEGHLQKHDEYQEQHTWIMIPLPTWEKRHL